MNEAEIEAEFQRMQGLSDDELLAELEASYAEAIASGEITEAEVAAAFERWFNRSLHYTDGRPVLTVTP